MKIRPTDPSFVRRAYEPSRETTGTGFGDVLKRMVNDVNSLQGRAESMTESAVAGAPLETHDVMVALEESRLAFDLMLEVRNKLLDAYRELMQMRM
jgi:flagellar hook-basal body complex protein FliE